MVSAENRCLNTRIRAEILSYFSDTIVQNTLTTYNIYALLQSKCKKQRRTERDQQIVLLAKIGTKKSEIAKRFGISRQQVYNVLRCSGYD
ncbi:MAG: hypothetical protein CL561_13440 [Alphaproteobacteria bacterium]|nr:hypothetical protein [Alphaproteobacteria bacterium]